MNQVQNIHAYVPVINFTEVLPFLILLLGAIGCLVADAATDKEGSRKLLPLISGASILLCAGSIFFSFLPNRPFIEGTFLADDFSRLGSLAILFSALMVTVMGPRQVIRRNLPSGEFYTLILFAALGMILLAVSNELLTAFIALEILSLSLYVLAGIDRRSGKAAEASFKYFILGAFASAFLVFGIAFLFGATHTTYLHEMAKVFQDGGVTLMAGAHRAGGLTASAAEILPLNPIWVFLGFGLVFVGICFKLSIAPFHMWAPDVYEGANTPTAMYIATGSKVAAFAFLVHLVAALSNWPLFASPAAFIIGLVAVTSMVWGNIAALIQSNIKRMLAYSSIAHTGYLMVGILVLVTLPQMLTGEALETADFAVRQAIVLYLAGYTVMNVLSFGLAFHIGGEGHMAAYRGLFQRKPVAAFGMAIAMFSLVGIGFTPPTIGFMAKFYLFKEAVQYGLVEIAVIAVLASVISAFYYLSLVVTMFMKEPRSEDGIALAGSREERTALSSGDGMVRLALASAAILIFVIGFYPGLFLSLGYQFIPGVGH